MTSDLSKPISANALRVLDCTLRDGGYYNDWHFPRDLVKRLVSANLAAGVRDIELGFRFSSNKGYKGALAFTTDDYLHGLELPQGPNYLVMINVAEYLGDGGRLDFAKLSKTFPIAKSDSVVVGVRAAFRYSELFAALEIQQFIEDRGYDFYANLMQMTSVSEADVEGFGRSFYGSNAIALYLADSLGSAKKSEVASKFNALSNTWQGPVGIHAHDNLGAALSNSLAAVDSGATFVDGTVRGMGRGAGNLRLEEFLLHTRELDKLGELELLLELATEDFSDLQAEYRWGYSPLFVLSGLLSVHPSYAQEILDGKSISDFEGMRAIVNISRSTKDTFEPSRLIEATSWYSKGVEGTATPEEIRGQSVLLLGPTEISCDLTAELRSFALRKSLKVVALNTSQMELDDLVEYRFFADPLTIQRNYEYILSPGPKKVLPLGALPQELANKAVANSNQRLVDLGLEISSDIFGVRGSKTFVRKSLAIHYALAALVGAGVNELFVAGFGGYSPTDERQKDALEAFEDFANATGSKPRSLTETSYDIEILSPYAP